MSADPNESFQPQPSSTLAILSLLCSGLGLVLMLPLACCCAPFALPLPAVGVVFGIIALGQIADGRATGRELAWIGIAVGAVALLIPLAFLVLNLIGVAVNMPDMMKDLQREMKNMPRIGK